MNPNSRHSSIGILVVISQLTREAQSRHRNGNPYGHDQTNNCHIIACRSEYRLGTARRYYQGTRSLAQSTTKKTGRRRMEEGAFFENAVDVRFVGQNFFAALAHRRKIFPKFVEKLFLEIAVAGSAFQELFAHRRVFILGRDE